MSADRVVPVVGLCVLALIAFFLFAKEKKNQILDGVFIRVNLRTEFYPGIKNCPVSGSPYWLVPNSEFDQGVSTSDLKRLVRGGWRVKVAGDVSRLGFYGLQGKYWRQLDVTRLLKVEELDSCENVE
jgi:hypothetical protein